MRTQPESLINPEAPLKLKLSIVVGLEEAVGERFICGLNGRVAWTYLGSHHSTE